MKIKKNFYYLLLRTKIEKKKRKFAFSIVSESTLCLKVLVAR